MMAISRKGTVHKQGGIIIHACFVFGTAESSYAADDLLSFGGGKPGGSGSKYGVRVESGTGDRAEVRKVTISSRSILELLGLLMRNTVTPVSLRDCDRSTGWLW